jgi:hypothetical protein
MEFTVSNYCYLCVLASTVLQMDSKVERWQCRESKLTLPPTHQRMPTREHIPFIYVISRIYADKVRLKTSLWVCARQMMQPWWKCMWQGVRHGHKTLLPWQLLSVFFLKAEIEEERSAVNLQPRLHKTQELNKKKRDLQSTCNLESTRLKRRWMNHQDPSQELMKKKK